MKRVNNFDTSAPNPLMATFNEYFLVWVEFWRSHSTYRTFRQTQFAWWPLLAPAAEWSHFQSMLENLNLLSAPLWPRRESAAGRAARPHVTGRTQAPT
jgi:hypothetical protein